MLDTSSPSFEPESPAFGGDVSIGGVSVSKSRFNSDVAI